MKKSIFLFLFIAATYSKEVTLVANTITVTREVSLEDFYRNNYSRNKVTDACWKSFKSVNNDLSQSDLLPIGTVLYLPDHDNCEYIKKDTPYITQVILPNEDESNYFSKLKEAYQFGIDMSYSYSTLNGTNSLNNTKLQLISDTSYTMKLTNNFTFANWVTELNINYQRTRFNELESTKLIGNNFSQTRFEFLVSRRIFKNFSLGLYQEYGDTILHEGSGSNISLFKAQKWTGSIHGNLLLYKGKTITLGLEGFVGHSVVTADEKRNVKGGLNYLAQLQLRKSYKALSINAGLFHRVDNEENGIYKQELLNTGLFIGIKKEF